MNKDQKFHKIYIINSITIIMKNKKSSQLIYIYILIKEVKRIVINHSNVFLKYLIILNFAIEIVLRLNNFGNVS